MRRGAPQALYWLPRRRALGGPENHLPTISSLPAALFDALPIPAFALGADGRVIAWNVAAERAFGWPAAAVLGLSTPFAGPAARALLERAALGAAGAPGPLDLPFVARDGSPRRARLRASPLPASAGDGAVFIDSCGVDRAELDQHDPYGSSLLQTVIDAIPTPIWFKTTDGIYRGCNLAFEQALGKRRDELVGHPVEAAGPKDLATVYRSADRALFESGGTQFYEGELRNADGDRRKVTFHKAAFRDRSGAVVGLAGALVDVTGLRRAEDDLRRALDHARSAESRFSKLVESTPDLIVIHREGRVLFANGALARLVGRTAADLAGTEVLDWVHPDDRAQLAGRLRATGQEPPMEGRVLAAGDRHAPVEFISIGLEMPDGPVRVAIGRDLSERKRAEDRLQRSDRLASLGTLAAGVAHELNNPLSFILANSEWAIERLRQGCGGTDLEEVIRALGDVVQGAHRMRVIVSDLRSATRDETATDTLAPVDLRRVVDFATQLTRAELRPRARLVVDTQRVPPVFGSETRLGQVLVNLLVNAAHAMPDDVAGHNEIRVRLRTEQGQRVAISVSDNGCGIPPEARPHLFEPFFTTKPVGEGTGLGLWVCHGIVAAHGGEIEVESAEGEGTTFHVLLPAQEPVAGGAGLPSQA
jgi:PAS domain S-box-containing protein